MLSKPSRVKHSEKIAVKKVITKRKETAAIIHNFVAEESLKSSFAACRSPIFIRERNLLRNSQVCCNDEQFWCRCRTHMTTDDETPVKDTHSIRLAAYPLRSRESKLKSLQLSINMHSFAHFSHPIAVKH